MTFVQMIVGQTEWNSLGTYWLPIGFKVVLSIICGGVIGLERELKHKPAGLRTNILICLGAVLFTSLSVIITETADPGRPGDPGRIAAQIVSGIGFLGGGMIIQSGGAVSGLTSAATVWVVAAIGVCIGLGYPIMATIFTVTVFFTLSILSKVDNRLLGKLQCYELTIYLSGNHTKSRSEVMSAFKQGDLELTKLQVDENGDGECSIRVRYFAPESRHLRIQAALWGVPSVERINVVVS
ncbi:MAG: MgtC/SapB family protein [Oligoflexia bacterium]|nr:MgtC/SapB family protein [Oligoflexia bacterium]